MKKGLGDKVLGWFIVDADADAQADADADANANANANADADADADASANANANVNAMAKAERKTRAPSQSGAAPPRAVGPIVTPGHAHDARAFAAVYRAAGVADDERDRLTKVLSLVESLPAEATSDVKRAIVAASLEAFGVSIDRILVTGEGALAALDGYVVAGQSRTAEVLDQAEARIAKLNAEIAEVRRLMDMQVTAQQELARATATEKARVRVVLDFFDNGASGRAAPAPRLVRLK